MDGPAESATFDVPIAIAVDSPGNVYVADANNHAIRKITPGGMVSTLAGTGEDGFVDGPGEIATFSALWGLAVDGDGLLYVADLGNEAIREITPLGVVSTYLPEVLPCGVAVDDAGNVYYVDMLDMENQMIFKIKHDGDVLTLGRAGPMFKQPWGVGVDNAGTVYVADTDNHAIRKITRSGVFSTLAGTGAEGFRNGPGAGATFNSPMGLAVDRAANVYVADSGNHAIRKITAAGVVSTLAGTGEADFLDGECANAKFATPYGVAVDRAGNVYIADSANNAIRKITA